MTRWLIAVLTLAICFAGGVVHAEEFKLPDAAEVSSYSPDALGFYHAGLKGLDKVDYVNAYSNLAKAAQLQPGAVRLNLITAALALKHGRSKPAAEAKGYYETAVTSLQSVLRQPGLDEEVRRDATNRLKVATDERNNLAQRDARREAVGGRFITDLSKEFKGATPAAAPKAPGSVPAGPATGPAAMPGGAPAAMPGMAPAAMPGAAPAAMPVAAPAAMPAMPSMPEPAMAPQPVPPPPAPAAPREGEAPIN